MQSKQEGKLLKEFKEILKTDQGINDKIEALKGQVSKFATSFPMPGHDEY